MLNNPGVVLLIMGVGMFISLSLMGFLFNKWGNHEQKHGKQDTLSSPKSAS
jgi:predicted MFS family arabinose efflux permease